MISSSGSAVSKDYWNEPPREALVVPLSLMRTSIDLTDVSDPWLIDSDPEVQNLKLHPRTWCDAAFPNLSEKPKR